MSVRSAVACPRSCTSPHPPPTNRTAGLRRHRGGPPDEGMCHCRAPCLPLTGWALREGRWGGHFRPPGRGRSGFGLGCATALPRCRSHHGPKIPKNGHFQWVFKMFWFSPGRDSRPRTFRLLASLHCDSVVSLRVGSEKTIWKMVDPALFLTEGSGNDSRLNCK